MSSRDNDFDPAAEDRLRPASGILKAIIAVIVLWALFFWWLLTAGAPPEFPVRPHQRGMMIEHSTQS
jgi:hypothetical protein